MMAVMTAHELRQQLEASREALLRALTGLTERDFASQLEGGESVLEALAALARAERATVEEARAMLAGKVEESQPASSRRRALPPQVIHDLAGARHTTMTFLEGLDGTGLAAVAERLAAIAEREVAAARRIEGRPAGGGAA